MSAPLSGFQLFENEEKICSLTSDLLRQLNKFLIRWVGPCRGRLARRECLKRSLEGWSQGLRDDWAHNSAAAGHQDESEILFPDSGHELVVPGAAQAHVCRVVSLINRSVATLTKLAWGHSSISSLTVRDMLQLDLLSSCWLPARPWLLRRVASAGMSGRYTPLVASERKNFIPAATARLGADFFNIHAISRKLNR